MDPTVEYACWYICSILSLSVAAVFFCISQFVELQFANSKLPFSIFIVILLILLCTFTNKPDFIRTKMDLISMHRFRWILKAIVEFSILVFVTILIVLMKYPRFRVYGKQDGSIFVTSKQGDRMGFFSAVAFCFYIFSTSMLLKLREEYGLFYMCLELTMNAAVEIPGIEGSTSILNWYYVGPTAFYCFLLIIVRCYYHSSDEVRRGSGNGDDGNDEDRQPTEAVLELVGDELRQSDLELNQQADGDDGAEDGGGGGRITGDQGCRTDLGGGWEILSAEEGDEHKAEKDVEKLSTSNVHSGRRITKRKQAADVRVPHVSRERVSLITIFVICVLITTFQFCLTDVYRSLYYGDKYNPVNLVMNTALQMILMIVTWTLWRKQIWIRCKRNCNHFLGETRRALERLLGLKLNQEGGSHDGAEGGGRRKTGDQGHSADSGQEIVFAEEGDQGHSADSDQEIVFAEEGDEHKADRAEGTSSFDEITSTRNVPGERVIRRRKHAGPSDQEKFPRETEEDGDVLNARVEKFIKKFNQEMKLQGSGK